MEPQTKKTSQKGTPSFFCEVGILTPADYQTLIFPSLASTKSHPPVANDKLEISQVSSFGDTIGFIDQNNSLWVYQMDDARPLNLSFIIGLRVREVLVGCNQMLISCEEQSYLVYFGSNLAKQPPKWAPKRYNPKRREEICFAFAIFEVEGKQGKYFMSYNEKQQKHQINMVFGGKEMRNLESGEVFKMENEIVGVSVSKYHSVCWDIKGEIYSWGSRSPSRSSTTSTCHQVAESTSQCKDKQMTLTPRRVEQLREEFVFCAVAEEFYCLALNEEGELLEWGQRNGEEIYPYRRVRSKYRLEKMISIKGWDKTYVAMGVSGKLFLWGSGATALVGSETKVEAPVPLKRLNCRRFSDFEVSDGKVVVIKSGIQKLMRRFKLLQLKGVKSNYTKILKSKMLLTQGSILQSRVKSMDNEVMIDLHEDQLQDQENINYICSRPATVRKSFFKPTPHFNKLIELNKKTLSGLKDKGQALFAKIHCRIASTQHSNRTMRDEVETIIRTDPSNNKSPKQPSHKSHRTQNSEALIRKSITYEKRLQLVSERRNRNDLQHLVNITENTPQQRRAKNELMTRQKRKETLAIVMDVMMRQWICKVLTNPVMGAKLHLFREVRNSAFFESIIRKIQSIYFKQHLLKKISKLSYYARYIVLRFLKRTKQRLLTRRQKQASALLLTNSAISVTRSKVSRMLMLYTFTIKKYQKIARWRKQTETNKLLSLRIKWNLSLINSNILECKEAMMFQEFRNKEFDGLQAQDIYDNILQEKPHLSLECFVDIHPIFRINFNLLKKIGIKSAPCNSIVQAPPNNTKKNQIVQKMIKRSKVSKIFSGRVHTSKPLEFQRLKVFPYSLDYQRLLFSRKFSVRIPEQVLLQPRWAQYESLLLQHMLLQHMRKNKLAYLQKLDNYDLDMAKFLSCNFYAICEKRARYLLIPAMIPDVVCSKLRRDFDRVVKKGGIQDLVMDFLMEDRHILLHIALKLEKCPLKPVIQESLSKAEFREMFILYSERIARSARVFNVKNSVRFNDLLEFPDPKANLLSRKKTQR